MTEDTASASAPADSSDSTSAGAAPGTAPATGSPPRSSVANSRPAPAAGSAPAAPKADEPPKHSPHDIVTVYPTADDTYVTGIPQAPFETTRAHAEELKATGAHRLTPDPDFDKFVPKDERPLPQSAFEEPSATRSGTDEKE